MPSVASVPATNEPIAAVASAGPPRPALAILLPSSAVDHRGAFARRVDQDRGGRAAIHAAVVDAGEHDQRARRIELEGDRQQQRDGQRRADAGQHADRGAEQHADQRVEQVDRLESRSRGRATREVSASMAGLRAAVRSARRQRQGEELGEQQIDGEAEHRADDEIGDDGARPNAAAVAANSTAVAGMKPPPKPDDGDQRGEAAENEHDGFRVIALALGEVAAPGEHEIGDREQRQAGRDHIRPSPSGRGRRSARAAGREASQAMTAATISRNTAMAMAARSGFRVRPQRPPQLTYELRRGRCHSGARA